MEKSERFLKNNTFAWSSNLTSEYISKEIKSLRWKGYLQPHVACSIIHKSQNMKTT